MSSKTVYSCDHCSKECNGGEYASIGRWDEPGAIIFGKTIHGCSKEHLGLAVVKAFGIPIDGSLAELLAALALHDLPGEPKALARILAQRQKDAAQRDLHVEQLRGDYKTACDVADSLREQLAHATPTVDGKTPGQVAHEAWRAPPGVRYQYTQTQEWADLVQFEHEEWEVIARAVLSAFAPVPTRAVREALGRVRAAITNTACLAPWGDGSKRSIVWTESAAHIIDDELTAHPTAELTGPKKPTKPAIDDCEAYIEARMDYRRVAGGTAAEMEAWWTANRASFRHDERMVMANGDIVRDTEFEE